MLDFDAGSTSGATGPFLNWTPKGREDGTVERNSWYVSRKDEDGNKSIDDVTAKVKKGVIFDVESLMTGWGISGESAPEFQWNSSISKFQPQPAPRMEGGKLKNWGQAVSASFALSKDEAVLWQQYGPSAFETLKSIMAAVNPHLEKGKLPVVKMTGHERMVFKKGSGGYATFEFVKNVERPDVLTQAAPADDFATGAAEEADEGDEF